MCLNLFAFPPFLQRETYFFLPCFHEKTPSIKRSTLKEKKKILLKEHIHYLFLDIFFYVFTSCEEEGKNYIGGGRVGVGVGGGRVGGGNIPFGPQ